MTTRDEHISRSAQWATEWFGNFLDYYLRHCRDPLFELTESPLEEAFVVWWEAIWVMNRVLVTEALFLYAQEKVTAGGHVYRLDFQVICDPELEREATAHGIAVPLIAVELDGHDFHERTREQVAARDQRDRDLQMVGWTVFHFSGSEFHRDPAACITTVRGYAAQMYKRLRAEIKRLASASVDNPVDGR